MVSPRKAKSFLSQISEGSRQMPSIRSTENFYSRHTWASRESVKVLYRKTAKMTRAINKQTSELQQRVLSARLLRTKILQSQLDAAHRTIADLSNENQALRTIKNRQDSVLSRYESTIAKLPQLLHSQSEKFRAMHTKNRKLHKIIMEIEQKLRQKEQKELEMSDQIKYCNQQNKNKSFEDRHPVTNKLNGFEKQINQKNNAFELLARKFEIQIKTLQMQLQNVQKRSNELMRQLYKNNYEMSELRKLHERNLTEQVLVMEMGRSNVEPQLHKSNGRVMVKPNYSLNNQPEEPINHIRSKGSRNTGTPKLKILPQTVKKLCDRSSGIAPRTFGSTLTSKAPKQPQRRVDRGGGDAAVLDEMKKLNKQNKLPPKKPHPSSQGNYNNGHAGANGINDDSDDNEIGAIGTDKTIFKEMKLNDDEGKNTDDDVVEDPNELIRNKPNHISKNQKKLSVHFQEREASLDSFCGQALNNACSGKLSNQKFMDKGLISSDPETKLLATIDDKKFVEKK